MTRTGRPTVVPALAVAGCLAASLQVVAVGPALAAVVSYSGALPVVAGVEVVDRFPAVGAALVRGDAGALSRLARSAGVRGISPDAPVTMAGSKAATRDGGGVYASEGLDGQAGSPHAGRGVRVAVVDTGVSDSSVLSRADGRLVDAADTSAVGDGGEVRTEGRFTDGFGHGTFMASLIAGGSVDGKGPRTGVAPGAQVLVVRVSRPDGTSSLSKVVAGLDWLAAHPSRVDVANLSFAHTRPMEAYGADPLTDAVERVRDAGVTVVVAAGNTPDEVGDPGFLPRALTVGAADLTDTRASVASFSGSATIHGVRKPDVVASGVGVLGVLPADSVIARSSTSTRTDGLWKGSGTSQATAVTSGLAALLLARHPSATPAQVKASLRAAADDLEGRRDGAGLVSTTTRLVSGPDGEALDGSGDDLTGEGSFQASTWGASSWGASSWGASTWARASTWAASTWAASTWATGRFRPADDSDAS
ncbi:MAG: S8 family serine peptidase [Mycobacteriales bacterium]|nr:S8 family serine peptidase [Mycobacteriales bacterium]